MAGVGRTPSFTALRANQPPAESKKLVYVQCVLRPVYVNINVIVFATAYSRLQSSSSELLLSAIRRLLDLYCVGGDIKLYSLTH